MKELREAAERYQTSAYNESEEDMEQCFADRCQLAEFALKHLDQTPLTDLSDEQLIQAGLTRHQDFWRIMLSDKVYIVKWDAHKCVFLYNFGVASKLHSVTTLGQLRHLMAAIGGVT